MIGFKDMFLHSIETILKMNKRYKEDLKRMKELEEMMDMYYKDRKQRLNNIHKNK